jgi:arsenite-transporting ATPase
MLKYDIVPRPGETRFIFFSGKGGVGKSTMSCATAVWLARQGYKTLLVTTDPAPNLADIFEQAIGHRVTQIDGATSLYAIEIDPDKASDEYREHIIAPMRALLDEKSIAGVKEQLNSPCVEEVAAFNKFIEFMDQPAYDVVIFDTAPTGHTLRLLELPAGWSQEIDRGGATCIGPSASLQDANTRYKKAISLLQDGTKTSFIFVLKPEMSSLLETRRSLQELATLGIKSSCFIINGILPEEACTDGFFKSIKETENEIVGQINQEYSAIPRLLYPLRDTEVIGLDSLQAVGKVLYEGMTLPAIPESSHSKPEGRDIFKSTPEEMENIMASLVPSNGTRYLFFMGKGGVGKSTLASLTAVYLANRGFKTLLLTTDPASHLHNILGQEVGHEPTEIKGVASLFAARIDQKKALYEYRERILGALTDCDESTRRSVEEDLNSPCAEEMAALEKFISYFEPNGYDIIVFDTAPTGHTLRLLELPSDWKGFIDLGTLTKQTSGEVNSRYGKVIETMRDRSLTTFVFVMYPEYTPIIEAWRAAQDLGRQVGIEVTFVAVNYLLPVDHGENSFFDKRRAQQAKYLSLIKEKFQLPILGIPLLKHQPEGLVGLRRLSGDVFCNTQVAHADTH